MKVFVFLVFKNETDVELESINKAVSAASLRAMQYLTCDVEIGWIYALSDDPIQLKLIRDAKINVFPSVLTVLVDYDGKQTTGYKLYRSLTTNRVYEAIQKTCNIQDSGDGGLNPESSGGMMDGGLGNFTLPPNLFLALTVLGAVKTIKSDDILSTVLWGGATYYVGKKSGILDFLK